MRTAIERLEFSKGESYMEETWHVAADP